MADQITCDKCGATGWRRYMRIAPEGWLYATFCGSDSPGEIFYVYACSEACARVEWRTGPGSLDGHDAVSMSGRFVTSPCEAIASRIRTHDGHTLHVLVFEAEDLPGTWVAHILDCDLVTQGTSPGDAIDMALDAWDCVPPEGRSRSAPVEDWRRWVLGSVAEATARE